MKRLSSILVLVAFILGSCEKANLNEEKFFDSIPVLKHNSFAILDSKPGPDGMPETTIAKNGVVQDESIARLFCKETVFELVGGQSIPAGNVIISNDAENLYVTFKTDFGWEISEIHIYAGTLENVPVNNSGTPVPGQFPIKESFNTPVEMVTYEIPLSELPDCPYILAHASVVNGEQGETAWGKGELTFEEAFGSNRWGWVMKYCPEECKGKDLVIGLKSYVVDPKTYVPETGTHLWWVVTKGEGSQDNCLSLGFNTFNTAQTGSSVYDLIKYGGLDAKSGTMTVFTTAEDNISYLNIVIDLDDEALAFGKSYLYVGSESGLLNFQYIYNSKNCYTFYDWFFKNDEISNPKTFKIKLADIKEK